MVAGDSDARHDPPRARPEARQTVSAHLDEESAAALAALTADGTSRSAAVRAALVESAVRMADRPPVPKRLAHYPYAQAMALHGAIEKVVADAPPLSEERREMIHRLFESSRRSNER